MRFRMTLMLVLSCALSLGADPLVPSESELKNRGSIPTVQDLNKKINYKPKPEDLSPEGFNWVHRDFALILSAVISEEQFKGIVKQDSLTAHGKELLAYLEGLRKIPKAAFLKWEETHQISFLMNAYLAHVLYSRMGGNGVLVFSKQYPFKTFIDEEIVKRFSDPRIILGLSCFEPGCPEFRNRAINFKNLEERLDVNAARYVNDGDKVRVDGKAKTLILRGYLKPYVKLIEGRYGTIFAFVERYLQDEELKTAVKEGTLLVRFDR